MSTSRRIAVTFLFLITFSLLSGCSSAKDKLDASINDVKQKTDEVSAELEKKKAELEKEYEKTKAQVEKKVNDVNNAVDSVNKVFEGEESTDAEKKTP
jgi:peptidoglycan hydrolase CwlO-like protein